MKVKMKVLVEGILGVKLRQVGKILVVKVELNCKGQNKYFGDKRGNLGL